MLADIFCSPRPASSFIPFRNTILGHPQMPIALLPTEERDASYSILVHAGSEYPTVRYRAHPSIDMLSTMQNTTFVWLSIDLMCNYEMRGFQFFVPNSIFLFTDIFILIQKESSDINGFIFLSQITFTSSQFPSSLVRRSLQNHIRRLETIKVYR